MALVKCAEYNNLVSSKTNYCRHCGYSPKGNCISCKHFEQGIGDILGRCTLTKNEFVRNDKSVCPAVIKRFIF